MKNPNRQRSVRGQLGVLFLLIILLAAFYLAAVATDTNHIAAVQAELHNATDAGALAGAQDLWFNIKNAEADALRFAAANQADGKPVSNDVPGRTVSVQVIPPTLTTKGKVIVDATCNIGHIFALLFGRNSDTLKSHSVAGTTGQLWLLAANQAFPIAVSIDAVPSVKDWKGRALSSYALGEEVSLYMGNQGVKNATFTSLSEGPANASWINDAVKMTLGLKDQIDGFIPSVKIGEMINLDNGMLGQNIIAKGDSYAKLSTGPTLILPLITGSSPFNKERPVVGFIGLKVTGIYTHNSEDPKAQPGEKYIEKITGILTPVQVSGETGPFPTTGDGSLDGAISRLNLGPIQLIE